jgi:hypothetical protein
VFVTSTTYTSGRSHSPGGATFASLADADAICNERAQAGRLPGFFRAWLSTATVDAQSRLMTTSGAPARGFVRPDGRPFADSIITLRSGQILYPLSIDELGHDWRTEPSYTWVATGTTRDGVVAAPASDWSSSTTSFMAGVAQQSTIEWTEYTPVAAGTPAHLYCFATDVSTPLSLGRPSGRAAFVSVNLFSPSAGLSAADAHCQTEATTLAGLPGAHRYQALLATTSASAISRFDLSGPTWIRLDGVPWVARASDLASGSVLATLNVDAQTSYGGYPRVWTGAVDPASRSVAADQSCSDWKQASPMGLIGLGQDISSRFFSEEARPCTDTAYLYCLQTDW